MHKAHRSRTLLAAALLATAACVTPASAAERLVVLSSDVAEIVTALGRAQDVVGRDRASRQPELAHATDIGSSRSLSAEPIARLSPTLVLGTPLAQPPGIYKQLEKLGLRTVLLTDSVDGSTYGKVVRDTARLLGATAEGEKLAAQWEAGMKPRAPRGDRPTRVLITYEGKTVAGRNTPSDLLIRSAGGVNAAAEVDGNKPLNPEAIAALAPDVILVGEHNRAVYGGLPAFKARPDIAATPAGKQGRVFEVVVQDYFTVNLDSPRIVDALHDRL